MMMIVLMSFSAIFSFHGQHSTQCTASLLLSRLTDSIFNVSRKLNGLCAVQGFDVVSS